MVNGAGLTKSKGAEVLTTSDWVAIGGIAVPVILGVLAWVRRVERQLSHTLTNERHDKICMERTARLEKRMDDQRDSMDRRHGENTGKLDHIELLIERQNEQSALHRSLVGDSLATIRTQVAVIRDRMGDDPLKDNAGRYRREEGG